MKKASRCISKYLKSKVLVCIYCDVKDCVEQKHKFGQCKVIIFVLMFHNGFDKKQPKLQVLQNFISR